MSNRRNDIQSELDFDVESTGSHGRPVRLRRSARSATTARSRSSRRKAGSSRRKGAKVGGIHQRANKRANW